MKILAYKQYVENHPEKYNFAGELSKESIIQDFKKFPWIEECEKSKGLIEAHGIPHFLLKKGNTRLYISINKDYKYDVTIERVNLLTRQFTSENKTSEQVEELIRKFSSLNFNEFIVLLKKSKTERFLNFSQGISIDNKSNWKSTIEYKTKTTRLLGKMLVTLLLYFFSILVFSDSLKVVFISLITISVVNSPAIYIMIHHLSNSKNKSLKFFRRTNNFDYYDGQNKTSFSKENIHQIIYHESKTPKLPWGDFDYTEFIFKDGGSIYISSLIIDEWNLMDEFCYIKRESVTEWFQIIKQ